MVKAVSVDDQDSAKIIYDSQNRVIQIVDWDSSQYQTTFLYSGNNIVSYSNDSGAHVTMVYDNLDRATTAIDSIYLDASDTLFYIATYKFTYIGNTDQVSMCTFSYYHPAQHLTVKDTLTCKWVNGNLTEVTDNIYYPKAQATGDSLVLSTTDTYGYDANTNLYSAWPRTLRYFNMRQRSIYLFSANNVVSIDTKINYSLNPPSGPPPHPLVAVTYTYNSDGYPTSMTSSNNWNNTLLNKGTQRFGYACP